MHYCCIMFDQLEHQTHDHCQFNNFLDNRNVHSDASTPSKRHCGRGIANFCVNQFIAPIVSAYYFMLWLWLGHLLFMSPVIQKNHWLSGLSHYCWQSVEDHQFCACSLVSNLSGVEYQDMQRVDLFLLIYKADNQQIKETTCSSDNLTMDQFILDDTRGQEIMVWSSLITHSFMCQPADEMWPLLLRSAGRPNHS